MLGARGENTGNGIAVLLRLINAVGKVFHPRQGVVARGVVPVGRLIKAELQPVEQVRFRHHVVMLRGVAWVARIVRDQHAVDLGQLVRLRAAGLTGIKPPQLVARRAILFIAQTAFLNILRLAVLQIGPVERAAGVDRMAEIPAEHHVIHAVAILRIALFDDFQPDQHPPDVQRREANFAGLVGVVHLLAADGVIGLVGQLVAEQYQGV